MYIFTCETKIGRAIRPAFLSAAFILVAYCSFAQLGWVQVQSPNPSTTRNMIRGISGTSSSDVWAVGSYEEVFNFNPYNVENDLILHWNGTGWQQYPAMQLSTTLDDLWDVEAIAVNNVWAVGMYNDFATTRAELLHYDGNSWTNQPLNFIPGGSYLNALHSISATDIWAAGGKSGSPSSPCYVLHYNGSSWSEIPVPTIGSYRNTFNDIHGTSSNDIWAAGNWGDHYGDFHALLMHWNGSNWSNVSLPSNITSQLSEMLSVRMVDANDGWAMGYYLAGGMFKLHWDGTNWTEVTPTNGGGGAFAVLSTNNVFSVGGEISHWDGSGWTIVDPLTQLSYPSLGSTVVFSNGEIWAGGRTVDASNNFHSLIYRSVNNSPSFNGGTTQAWTITPNSTNNAANNLLTTSDADVSQVLTYSVVTAPQHGSLNGLPTTAITNNNSATPTGITYTPQNGYMGSDQFVIRVAAGPVTSETTINVNVLGALPVTMVEFNVIKEMDLALLKWTTASESNSQKFLVEHSLDRIHFVAIGVVAAQGNSSIMSSYSFIHFAPSPGRNYYRLTLFDLDGKSTVFPVKEIRFDNSLQPIKLLSNPVTNRKLHLQINVTGIFQMNVYNQQGQKLVGERINSATPGNRFLINLPDLSRGVYVLQLMNGLNQYNFELLVK